MDLTTISEFDSSGNLFLPPSMMHVDVKKAFRRAEQRHRKIREQLPRGPNYSMRSELKRLKTFWALDPVSTWSPKEMASAGFFHTGVNNSCQCFCCGLVLCKHSYKHCPLDQHRRFNLKCEFIQAGDAGNIAKYDVRVQPKQPCHEDHREAMEDEQRRFQSFSRWPVYALVEASALAQAGFFFTGTRDIVQCFSCGGCLMNWEENDDPWQEHAKWFPECSFLLRQKNGIEIEQYISTYSGFTGVSGASFMSDLNKKMLPLRDAYNGEHPLLGTVNMLKMQLIKTYTDPTFHVMSTFGDSVSIDLSKLFADIDVVTKDIRNHPVGQVTLPDILSELRDVTIIEGEAGSGKTALLRKIALLWATGKCPLLSRFSLVFFISLSSTGSRQSLCDIICQQLVGDQTSLNEGSLGEILKLLKDNVLFLLDDYGSVDISEGIDELLLKNPWNRVTMAVTVSTDKSQKLRQYASKIQSIQKFPLYSTIYLVKSIFSQEGSKIEAFLLEVVTSQNVKAILQTPLIAVAQCHAWTYIKDYKFDDIHIFKMFIKCMLLKYDEAEEMNSQVTACGELALKGLFQSKFQFSDDDLRAAGVDSGRAIKAGLLSKFTAQRLKSVYQFFDPSFEEFLAGKRLCELLESDNQEEVEKGYHYLNQVNTYLKLIGRYNYFMKYASRISAKATIKILSYLFTFYDNPAALDCDSENKEHLQRHPELEHEENYLILILRKQTPIEADILFVVLLATIAVEASAESQCLPDCAPIIMKFLTGKTISFFVNIINNNSGESILKFLEKYPECVSLLGCIKFAIDGTDRMAPPDYSIMEKFFTTMGAPVVERDYSSAYVSLCQTKEDNEKSKKAFDEFYNVFPQQITIGDTIVHPFESFKHQKVPIFKLEVINMDDRKSSLLDCETFKLLFSISDHIELVLNDSKLFLAHIGSAAEQFSERFRKLTLIDSCLTNDEQILVLTMSSLQCLEIGCNHAENYPEYLIRGIHTFSNLNDVTVYLLQTPEVLDHLPEEFENLNKIKRLAFGCTGYSIGSVKFARFIQNFVDLESLHLSFKYYPDFEALSKSLSTCSKLKELSFFGSVLEEDDMASLAEALKNITSLKVLNLDRHKIIGANVSLNFANALGSLSHLEKLWLPVGEGMSYAAKVLIEQFHKLPNLQFLNMKEILDDDNVALLGEMANKGSFKRLCHLELYSNYKVSEAGWRRFFEMAGNMPELKILNIIRLEGFAIKSHASTVTAFVRFVSRLPSLTTIWMAGWLLDQDDLNMFNDMKKKHPQSKSLEIIWQIPLPFEPVIQD